MTEQLENRASILQRLASDDLDDVRAAAFDAGDAKLTEAVTLLAMHIQSPNMGVQEAAEFALRQIRGKTTVAAVLPLLRSEEASVRNSAMDVLRAVGSDDMRALGAYLNDADPDVRIFVADILGMSGQPIAVSLLSDTLLHDPEVNVRYQAGVSLGELGFPEAASALKAAMNDEEWVQFAVVEALSKIRADSCVDILISALPNATGLVASTIVSALGEMGNVKAAPMLLSWLDSISGPLRDKTVTAVVQLLGPQSLSLLGVKDLDRLRDYLIAALNDLDLLDVVLQGLAVVGGEQGARAVLNVAKTLNPDSQHELVEAVITCLVKIGCNASLTEGLLSNNERVINVCIKACGRIATPMCAEALGQAFWGLERDAQRVAATYLSQIRHAASEAFFIEVLDSSTDEYILKDALNFLGGCVQCTAAAPRMLELLDSPQFDVKEAALEACLSLNDPTTNVQLAALFRSADPIKRMMGVYAMGRIDARAHLDALTEALEDELPDIRKLALEAIGSLCMADPELLQLIIPRLNDENREVRLAMVALLGATNSADVLGELLQALDDEDDWVRIRAIEALERLHVPEILPRLVQMLEYSELLVMLKVIEALGTIGGKLAFRALLSLTTHEEPDVQQAATDALDRLRDREEI